MIGKYKRILIALDASEEADQVLEAATGLQSRKGDSFWVVTVVPPMIAGISGMDGASFAATWPLKDMEAEISREITDGVRERVARYGIGPDRANVLFGRPASEIHAMAESLEADLIVIGSHGPAGLPRLLLGSTANAVLHGAPCDVLTVRIRE